MTARLVSQLISSSIQAVLMRQGLTSARARNVIQQLSNQGMSKLAGTNTEALKYMTLHMTILTARAHEQEPLTVNELAGVM